MSEGVILIETFLLLAKRDTIKRCIERKASEVLQLFIKQVQSVRNEFEMSRQNPPLRLLEPQFAGSALWASSLAALVKESYEMVIKLGIHSVNFSTHVAIYFTDFLSLFLVNNISNREFEEAKESYFTLVNVIKEFKLLRYNQWLEDLNEKAKDNGLQLKLDKSLIRRIDSVTPEGMNIEPFI